MCLYMSKSGGQFTTPEMTPLISSPNTSISDSTTPTSTAETRDVSSSKASEEEQIFMKKQSSALEPRLLLSETARECDVPPAEIPMMKKRWRSRARIVTWNFISRALAYVVFLVGVGCVSIPSGAFTFLPPTR